MSDTGNYLKILEKMSELSSTLGVLNNEISHLKADVFETKVELSKINEQDIQQNKLLDQHILGVKTNMERLNVEIAARRDEKELIQKQIAELNQRMARAEFVPNLVSNLKTAIVWIAGVCTAVAAIGKVLHWF